MLFFIVITVTAWCSNCVIVSKNDAFLIPFKSSCRLIDASIRAVYYPNVCRNVVLYGYTYLKVFSFTRTKLKEKRSERKCAKKLSI